VGCGIVEVITPVLVNTGAEATGAIGARVGVTVGVAVGKGVLVGSGVGVAGGVAVQVGGNGVGDVLGKVGDGVTVGTSVRVAVGSVSAAAVGVTTTTMGCAPMVCQAYKPPSRSSTNPKTINHLKERIQWYIPFLIDVVTLVSIKQTPC